MALRVAGRGVAACKDVDGEAMNASNFHRRGLQHTCEDNHAFNTSERLEGGSPNLSTAASPKYNIHLDHQPTLGNLVYPLSHMEGVRLSAHHEHKVLDIFLEAQIATSCASDTADFTEFELVDYSIYLPRTVNHVGGQLWGLQDLNTKPGHSTYLFDGVLCCNRMTYYVQGVEFERCSIGNYGSEADSVAGQIWLQSKLNASKKSDVHYKLGKPSAVYRRYYKAFLWLADLSKHFVDFMQALHEQEELVSIHHFRTSFYEWITSVHKESATCTLWLQQSSNTDFRTTINANIHFLYKEALAIDDSFRKHTVWDEVLHLSHIPQQPNLQAKTIVTSYVFDCFEHLKCGSWLEAVTPVKEVEVRRKSVGHALHLTLGGKASEIGTVMEKQRQASIHQRQKRQPKISIGDVVAIEQDDVSVSKWKVAASRWATPHSIWYVLVQAIHTKKNGSQQIDGLWLYKPIDTPCSVMKYPYSNELFLSDHCLCDIQIDSDEVLFTVKVHWNGSPERTSPDTFFIRQTYLVEEQAFVSFSEKHTRCSHYNKAPSLMEATKTLYQVGDTVLVMPPESLQSAHEVEAAEIVSFTNDNIHLRRLPRRLDGLPNELIYTQENYQVSPRDILRKCYVRFSTKPKVPTPYDRRGTGDAYIITYQIGSDGVQRRIEDANVSLKTLRQGFDLQAPPPFRKLRGMDLYCGGGTFGRGLEEGGAVENTFAVDYNANAIHTYSANSQGDTKLFYGSVDDLLYQAFMNNPAKSELVAMPGDVDAIFAGSPCVGFSLLNSRKDSQSGLKAQSLVASVAAYVDFYRPKYAVLENVISMAKTGENQDDNMLSQLLCCFVGMGYQVRTFFLDAWSFGSPQSRSRVFVTIAAPGLKPMLHPGLSHSHPDHTNGRALGKLSNGISFATRRMEPTPFKFVSSSQGTEDLPNIGDGRTYFCASHPDHRLALQVHDALHAQMAVIPFSPPRMNFWRTFSKGLMTPAQRALFPTLSKKGSERQAVVGTSKAWGRVHPDRLFPTIATATKPEDARVECLHWSQQRIMTLQEARRAQSYPDDEVLIGIPSKQWRIVGNSVARTVALALGLSLREAWSQAPYTPIPDEGTFVPLETEQSSKAPITPASKRIVSIAPEAAASSIRSRFSPSVYKWLEQDANHPNLTSSASSSSSSLHSSHSSIQDSDAASSDCNSRNPRTPKKRTRTEEAEPAESPSAKKASTVRARARPGTQRATRIATRETGFFIPRTTSGSVKPKLQQVNAAQQAESRVTIPTARAIESRSPSLAYRSRPPISQPSAMQPAPEVIEISSDDEDDGGHDDDEDVVEVPPQNITINIDRHIAAAGLPLTITVNSPGRASASMKKTTYVPVDNSKLDVYAKTNRTMRR